MPRPLIITACALLFFSCRKDSDKLFRLVPSGESGITFNNVVEEKDTINILTVQYMYHGGAVAVGDFNNDNLTDIFFSGNMVPNKLYLNRGAMTFEDVSEHAGIGAAGKWNTGVALADVNADGLLDIYVCASINDDPKCRENSLFINKGMDGNGIPSFSDEATAYGIADQSYTQNAAFLDYDKDGDLDLFLLCNLESERIPSNFRPRINDGSALNNDRLYRNNGDNTFTEVTKAAGILYEGYGLGLAIADINEDGWPDIYITNDYVSNDILYINQQDGTFRNEIATRLKHQSLFSMGVDVADVNNDLHPDIITLDMLPENNLRRKTVSGAGASYMSYLHNREFGYEHQYMRNMLQANNGDGTFRDIGQMAGIHQTEWSWSCLLMDVDNDGLRDLMITNGFPKDVTDKDYVNFRRETGAFHHHRSLIDSIPVLKVPNYVFRNNGDFSFTDVTDQWGFKIPSFSNGAAFADFDDDGDLDYVVNNINDEAFLYENTLYRQDNSEHASHYLRIKLLGPQLNASGQGAKVLITQQGKQQRHEHSIYRGYLSTVEDVIHFGLGPARTVDTIAVEWPDGKRQTLLNQHADQLITIRYTDAMQESPPARPPEQKLFREISGRLGITYRHREWDKVDYHRQRTLPHKFSQAGPAVAVGDINGDGLEDFIVGGSSLYNTEVWIQGRDGKFSSALMDKGPANKSEDEGLLLFDADGDNDLDLYVVSGSYEGEQDDPRYQDRFYINDGRGRFTLVEAALPNTPASGSCVRAADFDRDGDLDLFVGGRVLAGSYPVSPDSYLLINDHGKFTDGTNVVATTLGKCGMVTDALWTDIDNDGWIDLVVVGEFMPVSIFRNDHGKLMELKSTGLNSHVGWWNSIAGADFDQDGDTDYIVGNLGINNYYQITDTTPLRVYAKDFDGNGSIDALLSCYLMDEQGNKVEYPTHFWDELNGQSPRFRKQFSSYRQFGQTSMQQLLTPYDTAGMIRLTANTPYSSYIENKGNGQFQITPLPRDVQIAPVNGIAASDINGDGFPDVLLIGNDYGNEVFSGRMDAFSGSVLLGDGKGNFTHRNAVRSGFLVDGDAKALATITTSEGQLFIASQNLDSLRVFKRAPSTARLFRPQWDDAYLLLKFDHDKTEKVELYYGAGYLSQSSRNVYIPENVVNISVVNGAGASREIDRAALISVNR